MTGSVNSAQTDKSSSNGKDGFAHEMPSAALASSPDLFDNLRKHSKSLSEMGQKLLKQLSKNSVSRLSEIPAAHSVINMTTDNQSLTPKMPNRANQLFRQQLPGITKQILGKRFNTVNKLANLVMPAGSFDKASDQILELLADFASTVSAVDHIIDEAGVATLAELQSDTARSGRLARALNEKNRYMGMAQGAISGATGVAGAAADIPLSMILALRTIYLTGRAYGFELNQPEDRAMIFEALSNADLSLITEKQAILIGLNSVCGMLGTGNIQGLQTMLGSGNDFEPLFKLLSDSNGQLKWRISAAMLNKVTPVIGGAVGAIYTSRLLKEVSDSAKQVFEQARQQQAGQRIGQQGSTATDDQSSQAPASNDQQATKDQKSTSTQQPQQASSAAQQPSTIEEKLVNAVTPATEEEQAAQKQAQDALLHNEDIAKVEIVTRHADDDQATDDVTKEAQIHDQLSALAHDMIDDHQDQSATTQQKDTAASTTDESDRQTTGSAKAQTRRAKGKDDTDESTAQNTSGTDQDKPARRPARKSTGAADSQPSSNTKH